MMLSTITRSFTPLVLIFTLSASFAEDFTKKPNLIESTLLDWGYSFTNMSGTKRVSYSTDVGGCLINGGDWVVNDIRNDTGEYCISHETFESYRIKEPSEDKPLTLKQPSTPNLMNRFMWMTWMYSNWGHRYPRPTQYVGSVEEIDGLYEKELPTLANDEHLAVYWLLHFKLLIDPRYVSLKATLRNHHSGWIHSAITYLDGLDNDKNYALLDKNSVLFQQRRAYAIYDVTHKHKEGLTRLWQSYLIDDSFVGSAQVFYLVKLAKENNQLPWLLEQVKSLTKKRLVQDYIYIQDTNLSTEEKEKAYERLLADLTKGHKAWKKYKTPLKILAEIVNDAPVDTYEKTLNLYYSEKKFNNDYLALSKEIAVRKGVTDETSAFYNVDIKKVNRVIADYKESKNKAAFLKAYDQLLKSEQFALITKATTERQSSIDTEILIRHLWMQGAAADKMHLKYLLIHHSYYNDDDLVELLGLTEQDKIPQIIKLQQDFLFELSSMTLEEIQKINPRVDSYHYSNYISAFVYPFWFLLTDSHVKTHLLDLLVGDSTGFEIKQKIYSSVFELYSEDFFYPLTKLSPTNQRLLHQANIDDAVHFPLTQEEKERATELLVDLLVSGTAKEYQIDLCFDALDKINIPVSRDAIVDLVINKGMTDIEFSANFKKDATAYLNKEKSLGKAYAYYEFLTDPPENSDLEEARLMSNILQWDLDLVALNRSQLIHYHEILLMGIRRGLELELWHDLPQAYEEVKQIEVQIKKAGKRSVIGSLVAVIQGQEFDEEFEWIDEYFEYDEETELFKRLASGEMQKQIKQAMEKSTQSISKLSHQELQVITNKEVNTRLWQIDSALLFADSENTVHYFEKGKLTDPPFKITPLPRNNSAGLAKNEKRVTTKLWLSDRGNIHEWVKLGSNRLLVMATNKVPDTPADSFDIDDYSLENLESVPSASSYLVKRELAGKYANVRVLLAFDTKEQADLFFDQLDDHLLPEFVLQEPWYLDGLGRLAREYDGKRLKETVIEPKLAGLFYPDSQIPFSAIQEEQEKALLNTGIAYYKYIVSSWRGQKRKDTSIGSLFNLTRDTTKDNTQFFYEWIKALKQADNFIEDSHLVEDYIPLRKLVFHTTEAAKEDSIQQLNAVLGRGNKENSGGVPQFLKSVWKVSASIMITEDDETIFEWLSPKKILAKTHPRQKWIEAEISKLAKKIGEQQNEKKANNFNKMLEAYKGAVFFAQDQSSSYYYLPASDKVAEIDKGDRYIGLSLLLGIDADAFSPSNFNCHPPKALNHFKLSSQVIKEKEVIQLVGGENELGETLMVHMLVDFTNHQLSIVANLPNFSKAHANYPNNNDLQKDVKEITANFKKLGMKRIHNK